MLINQTQCGTVALAVPLFKIMSKEITTTQKHELAAPAPSSSLDAQGLIALALEKQVPVETIERLADLAIKLKEEDAKTAYFHAIREFQAECPTIQKTRKVFNKDRATIRYEFARIDDIGRQIRPILDRCGLSYRFDTRIDQGNYEVTCIVTHEKGHSERSIFAAPIDAAPGMNKMQAGASANTFAKRYALCNALGIMTGDEDDDAQSVEDTTPEEKPAPAQDVKRVLWSLLKRQFGDDIKAAEQELHAVGILTGNENLKSLSEDRIKECIKAIREIERKRLDVTGEDLF